MTQATQDLSITLKREKKKSLFWRRMKKEFPFAVGSTPFIWQFFFFYLPLVILFTSSVIQVSKSGHFEGFTLEHFRKVLTPTYFHVIGSSLSLASITTLICLMIGFPLAYCIVFHGGKLKNFIVFPDLRRALNNNMRAYPGVFSNFYMLPNNTAGSD